MNKGGPFLRGDGDSDPWNEYRREVVGNIKRLTEDGETRDHRIVRLEIEIAVIKAKAAVFGGLAGFVGGGILTAIIELIVHVVTK